MATFVLIHGGGSDPWFWHLVTPELERLGHEVVTPSLPCDDDSAGLTEYTDVVVDAIGERRDLVLVAQSLAGFTGPLVCERVPVDLLVLLNAMVPQPGEVPGEWWNNTGYAEFITDPRCDAFAPTFDPMFAFLHDVPAEVAEESGRHVRDQSGAPFEKAWPLDRWPDVPTRVLVGRDDRFFPLEFARAVARDRLGIDPDEIEGGHCVALSRPAELAERLDAYFSTIS